MLYFYDVKKINGNYIGIVPDIELETSPMKSEDEVVDSIKNGFSAWIELNYRKKKKAIPLPSVRDFDHAFYIPIKLQMRILLWNTMIEKHISQSELAEKLEISKQYINQYFISENVSIEKYEEALNALGYYPSVIRRNNLISCSLRKNNTDCNKLDFNRIIKLNERYKEFEEDLIKKKKLDNTVKRINEIESKYDSFIDILKDLLSDENVAKATNIVELQLSDDVKYGYRISFSDQNIGISKLFEFLNKDVKFYSETIFSWGNRTLEEFGYKVTVNRVNYKKGLFENSEYYVYFIDKSFSDIYRREFEKIR